MKTDIMLVAEKLYFEANPNSKSDVPSFAYEQVERANIRRKLAQSNLSLYDWCKFEMEKNKIEKEFTADLARKITNEYPVEDLNHIIKLIKEEAEKGNSSLLLQKSYPNSIFDELKKRGFTIHRATRFQDGYLWKIIW